MGFPQPWENLRVCPEWHLLKNVAWVERQRNPGFTAFNPGYLLSITLRVRAEITPGFHLGLIL